MEKGKDEASKIVCVKSFSARTPLLEAYDLSFLTQSEANG